MKSIKAERIRIKIGDLWESPQLHILLTKGEFWRENRPEIGLK